MLLSDLFGFGDVVKNDLGLILRETLEVSMAGKRTSGRLN